MPKKRDPAPAAPAALTPDQQRETICTLLAEGMSLRAICAEPEMPDKKTVCRWLAKDATFQAAYAAAKAVGIEVLMDEIIDIADDASGDVKLVGEDEREVCNTEFVQRARLRVDTRKWVASKLLPKKYGEKVALVGGGEGDAPIAHQIDLSGLNPDQLRALASIKLPADA